jgi:tripartite-type tricarboxylate transporter receptor subunit TctC
MQTRRHFFHSSAATVSGAAGLLPPLARAQTLEIVRIVNGFPAGGTADSTSRRVGERLAGSGYTRNAAVVGTGFTAES